MSLSVRELIVAASVIVSGFALWKGGPAERYGAAFILVDFILISISQAISGRTAPSLAVVAIPALIADLLLAFGFLWLALRYSSLWIAAAMMSQALQLALYGSFLAGGGVHHRDFSIGFNVASVLLLLTILGGTAMSWRSRVVERRATLESEERNATPTPP